MIPSIKSLCFLIFIYSIVCIFTSIAVEFLITNETVFEIDLLHSVKVGGIAGILIGAGIWLYLQFSNRK